METILNPLMSQSFIKLHKFCRGNDIGVQDNSEL